MEDERICNCKFVFKSEIVDAINHKNALNIEDIQRITGASTGCGRCTRTVNSILKETLELNSEKTHD